MGLLTGIFKKTVKPTKLPAIPAVPSDTPPGLKSVLTKIIEVLDVRTGLKGDQRDRAVTVLELLNSGVIQ